MEKVFNVFELMKIIQKRPGMYLWDQKTVKSLIIYISAYSFWVWIFEKEYLLESENFNKFQDYIIEKTIWMANRTNECWKYWDCLLKATNNDEEKAFDLFFELMDEFIGIENISIDLPPPPDYTKMAQEWDNWRMSEDK